MKYEFEQYEYIYKDHKPLFLKLTCITDSVYYT